MTNHTRTVADPTALALTYLASADDHAANAREARALDTPEAHRVAGRFREEERLCLARAKILVGVAQAHALADLANSGHTIALAR